MTAARAFGFATCFGDATGRVERFGLLVGTDFGFVFGAAFGFVFGAAFGFTAVRAFAGFAARGGVDFFGGAGAAGSERVAASVGFPERGT